MLLLNAVERLTDLARLVAAVEAGIREQAARQVFFLDIISRVAGLSLGAWIAAEHALHYAHRSANLF